MTAPLAEPIVIDETDTTTDLAPDTPWVVIVWNDPINLMSYVAFVLQKLFGYSSEKANKLMLDVHEKGKAVVSTGPREKAEVDVFRLHEHGLWATMQQGLGAMLEKPPFALNKKNEIVVNLSPVERELLSMVFRDLRKLLAEDADGGLKRLYPTAYHDDAERDAGYQALVHGELLDGRLAALDEVEQTLDEPVLTTEQMTMWMTSINGARLVLGTRLDVGEEDDMFDPEAPDAQPRMIYLHLGWLLEHVVAALTGTLPPATSD